MENHQAPTQRPDKRYVLTLLCLIFESAGCLFYLLNLPSGSSHAVLWGLSKERLMMSAVLGLVLLYELILLVSAAVGRTIPEIVLRQYQQPSVKLRRLLLVLTLFFLFLFLLPAYRFDPFSAYYVRLRPFILLALLSGGTLLLSLIQSAEIRGKITCLSLRCAEYKRSWLIFVFISLLLIAFMEISGWGKTPENNLWNKNGIPLESLQIVLVILLFMLCNSLAEKRKLHFSRNLLPFFLVWFGAALIWSCAPKQAHFFAPGPYAPNNALYPYSDAMSYDISAQSALQGWGFNFNRTVAKPVLSYVLFLCHLLSHNNFDLSIMIQSALYGIMPAILFLFGSEIRGKRCGFLAAAFSILQEWNALHTWQVLTIHSRLMMSEFLMQILFACFCYFMFRWMEQKEDQMLFAAAAGGIFTLGAYTRLNFLAFLPAALLILLLSYRKRMMSLLKTGAVFFFAILLTAAPWLQRSYVQTGQLLPELSGTVFNVLLPQRFTTTLEESAALQTAEEKSMTIPEQEPTLLPTVQVLKTIEPEEIEPAERQETGKPSLQIHPLLDSIFNHSLHSISASFLTLPLNTGFDSLEHLFTNDENHLWGDNWNGKFSLSQWIMILIWVIALCAAIAFLWKRFGAAGLSIPYFWVVYAFSVGFSRSSAGRYIVPMNWVCLLLAAIFLSLFFKSETGCKNQLNEQTNKRLIRLKLCGVLLIFFCFFSSMRIFEIGMPSAQINITGKEQEALKPRLDGKEGDPTTAFEELAALKDKELQNDLSRMKSELDDPDIDWKLVEEQCKNGVMVNAHGIALYPRFYYFYKGEHGSNSAFVEKPYSRLIFTGIDHSPREYVMPHTEQINDFPHGSSFTAFSCGNEKGYYDVLGMVITAPDGETFAYQRDPLAAFSCPVQEPICLEIEKCY